MSPMHITHYLSRAIPRWIFPLCRDVPQRQVDQLGGRLVAGEMPLVPDRLADLAAQTFDGVGGVQNLAHLGKEGEKRDHFLPPIVNRDSSVLVTRLTLLPRAILCATRNP